MGLHDHRAVLFWSSKQQKRRLGNQTGQQRGASSTALHTMLPILERNPAGLSLTDSCAQMLRGGNKAAIDAWISRLHHSHNDNHRTSISKDHCRLGHLPKNYLFFSSKIQLITEPMPCTNTAKEAGTRPTRNIVGLSVTHRVHEQPNEMQASRHLLQKLQHSHSRPARP